jgi:butyryl-CoA:acetate CoA-transferase
MGWKNDYESKIKPVDEAVKVVKSGDWVSYGEFVMNSACLDAALARRVDELNNVKIRSMNCSFVPEVVKVDPKREHFIFNDWHFSGASRKLADKNLCNYIPINYHEVPSYFEGNYVETVDVAMIKVTSPDKHGFANLGTSVSFTPNILKKAKYVIAEINESVPRCLGGSHESVHVSEIDCFVLGDNAPLVELPESKVNEVDRTIAGIVMGMIEDGACLQLGIGAMPNTVGAMIAQSDLKDLGVHTEMLCDSFVDMYNAGRITNKRKNISQGKMVYTFAMGSKKLYDFLDNNSSCAIYPVNYTNDPYIIAQNDKVFSINNALEVDIYGQVASESSGSRHISGTGGQLNFIQAANMSKGGKGLICLSSTYTDKEGKLHSRIRPYLDHGTIITVPRSVCSHVVTEYGVAVLRGKSTWERAAALIDIAHPYFREELIQEAEKNHIWLPSNKRVYS